MKKSNTTERISKYIADERSDWMQQVEVSFRVRLNLVGDLVEQAQANHQRLTADDQFIQHQVPAVQEKPAPEPKVAKTTKTVKGLGERMLELAGLCRSADEGRGMLMRALESGAGLDKLREMITAQGGEGAVADDTGLLPQAGLLIPVTADQDGYIAAIYLPDRLAILQYIFFKYAHGNVVLQNIGEVIFLFGFQQAINGSGR